MSRRHRMTEEDAAELATEVTATVAMAGFLVVGMLLVSVFTQTARIWGEHAAPGQPAQPILRRGLKVFLAAWGVACLMALLGFVPVEGFVLLAPLGALVGVVATLAFVFFIQLVGARYDQVVVPPRSGELETYLAPFAEAEPDGEVVTPTGFAGTVPLRLIRTGAPGSGNGKAQLEPKGR